MNSACDIVCHIGENVNHTHQTNIYMAWTGHINASYPNVTMIRYLHLHGSCVYVIHRAPKLIYSTWAWAQNGATFTSSFIKLMIGNSSIISWRLASVPHDTWYSARNVGWLLKYWLWSYISPLALACLIYTYHFAPLHSLWVLTSISLCTMHYTI